MTEPQSPAASDTPHDRRSCEPTRAVGSGLSAHILPTSATMIGVCTTVLSIGHLAPGGELRMVVDKLLAVDALIFLVSAAMSFMSMRSRRFGTRYEARAEAIFIAGLGLLALVVVVLAFAIPEGTRARVSAAPAGCNRCRGGGGLVDVGSGGLAPGQLLPRSGAAIPSGWCSGDTGKLMLVAEGGKMVSIEIQSVKRSGPDWRSALASSTDRPHSLWDVLVS